MVDLSYVFGLGVVLGYALAVALGVPLAAVTLLLSRWVRPLSRALGYVSALPLLGLVAVAALVGSPEDPLSGVPAALTVAAVLALIWGGPLLVGRVVLVRYAGLDPERSLRNTLAGLPVGLLTSLVVFVAPGGTRYNLLFLEGVVAVLGWAAFLGALVVVPALVGLALARRFDPKKLPAV